MQRRRPRRLLTYWLLALIAHVGGAGLIHGGGGPQNIALVVNPNDPDSLAVANAYIRLRDIPGDNVVYIPWKPNVRMAQAAEFRDRLLKPLLAELENRKLTAQIDCVAYSSGFPYIIDFSADAGGKGLPPQLSPAASLTGATYLYEYALAGKAEMFALNANDYFAAPLGGKTLSLGFHSQQGWARGSLASNGGGNRYLLSTALGVTMGRGNTAAEIIAYLERAKQADARQPKGVVYYMQNNNVRSQVRHATYAEAIAELKALGVEAELLPGVAPTGKSDVAGLTTGTSHLQLRTSNCSLTPGALVDNLTSAAGQFQVGPRVANPQTPISEFLRMGAAGVSGTVVEPYAIAQKFPSAALHVHYARGLSLAEAFYRSIAAPYQLIVVGDPLCQPWAAPPSVTVEGLPAVGPLSGAVTLKPVASYPNSRQARRFELYVNGHCEQRINAGQSFTLETNPLADGWHDLRVVAIEDSPVVGQGAWTKSIQIKNGRDALQLLPASPRASVGGTLELTVSATTDRESTVIHNGRRLATAKKSSGRIAIDGAKLGVGQVTLHAVQEENGRIVLRSRPVTIQVE